jgi:hypothetical protein
MSLLRRLAEARAELAEHGEGPLRKRVEEAVRGKDTVSTAGLLQLLSLRANTGNARRVAAIMRALNFVPIKSRRLVPSGWRDTVARGWARPVRAMKSSPTVEQIGASGANQVGGSHGLCA